jgi:hypothetical protein
MPEISRFVVSAKASVTGKKEPMSAQSQDTRGLTSPRRGDKVSETPHGKVWNLGSVWLIRAEGRTCCGRRFVIQ